MGGGYLDVFNRCDLMGGVFDVDQARLDQRGPIDLHVYMRRAYVHDAPACVHAALPAHVAYSCTFVRREN